MLFSMFETINNKTEHVPHDKAEKTQHTETVSAYFGYRCTYVASEPVSK